MRPVVRTSLLAILLAIPVRARAASELAGSPASMIRQHAVAVEEDYTFLRTPADVQRLVAAGRLVPVTPTADYTLDGVSYPYTRPEVLSFVQHFAASYHAVTGSRLVITSLTRPLDQQPANAHPLSVHPAGMAVDLRVPAEEENRAFLERALLSMENAGLLDVTREHHPSHYHVAVFAPEFDPYAAMLDSVSAAERAARLARRSRDSAVAITPTLATPTPSPAGRLPIVIVGLLGAVGLGKAGAKFAGYNRAGL